MQRRVCLQAKSSWSRGISMEQAKPLKESRCFTAIPRSLPAHWTKPCWHIGKQATPRKRIAYRASCGSDIRITPVDNSSLCDWRIMAAPGRRDYFTAVYNAEPPGASPPFCRYHSLCYFRSATERSVDSAVGRDSVEPRG